MSSLFSSPQAPPPAPDPTRTAAQQTRSNVDTAVANSIIGNANEVGPGGTVTYRQTGSTHFGPGTSGGGGGGGGGSGWGGTGTGNSSAADAKGLGSLFGPGEQGYDIPQYERTVTLSPEEQQLYDQQHQLGSSLNNLAIGQTNRLTDVLGRPLDISGLPNAGNAPNLPSWMQQPMGFADTGSQQRDFAGTSPIQQQVNGAGPILREFGDAGNVQNTFGDAGNIQRSIGPNDYEGARKSVEDAIYSRLNPQLERDREAERTRLVNEGFTRGSDAYNTELGAQDRQANDARMQAVLAGGQEQSRLAGLDLQQGNFANNAQAQAYAQAIGRGQFGNQAQQQLYDQMFGRGQFSNAGQQQRFGQNLQSGQFSNAAEDQQFQHNLARGQFANQAQQNDYNQAQGRGTFMGQAIGQNNALAQQGFGNEVTAGTLADNRRERALQELLAFRNQPISEIASLMSGGTPSIPQFAQYRPGNVGGTDIGGMTYQAAALNQQNALEQQKMANATQNALIGGVAGLGGAGLYGLAGGKFKGMFG